MIWFHTLVLPLLTVVMVTLGVKQGAAIWKQALLVSGCALIVAGLWIHASWSTALIIAGGVTFTIGMPRRSFRRR